MNLKPYPKYKNSGIEWLGEIPEGWKVIPIRRIGKVINVSEVSKESGFGEEDSKKE